MSFLEIKAVFRGERMRFDSFTTPGGHNIVADAQVVDRGASNGHPVQNGDTVGIKGDIDDDLIEGQTYRLAGKWAEYKNKRTGRTEQQFAFSSYVLDEPAGRDAIIGYIEQAGKGNGIGKALATKLYDAWGDQAIATLRAEPERIKEVLPSFDESKAEQIAEWLRERQATEQTTMELSQLLKGRGFPRVTERQAIREWGARAVERITRDPFCLMRRFAGCGFKRCDALYLALQLDPNRLRRQMYCAWYAVSQASAQGGHTWVNVNVAVTAIQQSVSHPDVLRALKLAKRVHQWYPGRPGGLDVKRTDSDGVVTDRTGADVQIWLAESSKAAAESELAGYVVEAMNEAEPLVVLEYETVKEETVEIPRFARCARCGRLLTSEVIHVVDGKPYGPTCVEYVK